MENTNKSLSSSLKENYFYQIHVTCVCMHMHTHLYVFLFFNTIFITERRREQWLPESQLLISGAVRSRTEFYHKSKEEVGPGALWSYDSDLPFSAGRNQHPRHVWGADAGFVHAGDRVSFCELEGKCPAFPSPLSTHSSTGRPFVLAKTKQQKQTKN